MSTSASSARSSRAACAMASSSRAIRSSWASPCSGRGTGSPSGTAPRGAAPPRRSPRPSPRIWSGGSSSSPPSTRSRRSARPRRAHDRKTHEEERRVNFDLTDEQMQLRQAVREFVKKECPPEVIHRALKEGRHSEALWRRMAELGWLGVAIDERYGGSGGNIVDMVLIMEGLAPCDPAIGPYFTTVCFGGKSVGFFGSEAQKELFLPRIANGECVFALSITEPGGGTDVLGAMQTRAERDGDGWVLTGAKMFTSAGQQADHIVVVARTTRREAVKKAAEGITLFIVPAKAPGVTMRKIDTIVPIEDTNAVFYDQVRVPHSAVLGERSE